MRPRSNRYMRRRLQENEGRARYGRPGRVEGVERIVSLHGVTDLTPCGMSVEKRPGGLEGSCLLGVVHHDDATGPKETRRHLEIEEGELVVVIAVDQHEIEPDTTLVERQEEVH